MPDALQEPDGKAYFRKLMSYAVCMEVVPFKSNNEKGVESAVATCWENFTQHILLGASAPIFVLVGKTARQAFLDHALDDNARNEAKRAFDHREIYPYQDPGGTERLVVYVKFNQGKISRFHKYFSPEEAPNTDTLDR